MAERTCATCGRPWLNAWHVCTPDGTEQKQPLAKTTAPADRDADRDLCILVGGSRDSWTYFADELVRNGKPTSLARGYSPTQTRVRLRQHWPFDTSKWADYQCWVWQAKPL